MKSSYSKATLLTLSIAAALAGCGGSNSSSGGSKAKNSTVCIDSNMNAVCDAGEKSEKVVTWDKKNPVETSLKGSAPLAYKGENGYIFTAPAGFPKIYAGTTMLNSELIYNQVISDKTKEKAKAYVHGKFGGKPSVENKKDIADAIKNAIKANPKEDRYAVIAAVMNKIIALAPKKSADIKNIKVSAAEIKAADKPSLQKLEVKESLSKNIDDVVKEQITNGWVDAKDSGFGQITAKNGKVVGASHYHNALSVLDVSTKELKHSAVSVITDAGHGKTSPTIGPDTDTASGASENYIREATLNSNASFVYVNIPPKSSKSTAFHTGTYGLYKAKIEADGSIKTTKSGTVIAIDETGSKRLKEKVTSFAVAPDDSKVVVLDSEKNLTVYDGNLENPDASIETGDLKMGAYTASSKTVYAVTANPDDDTKTDINKWAIGTLTGSDKITLDFKPQELVLNADGTKLAAFNHGHDNKGQMNIAIIDLSNDSINASSIKMKSDTGAFSPDFSTMVAVGHEESRMLVVNLTIPGFSVQSSYPMEHGSRDVAFVSDTQVAVFNDRNSMAVIDLKKTTGNVNLDTKMALALDGLNRSSINGGGYFNAVIKDLNLPDKYENIAINWAQTGLDNNLDVVTGKVTRPGEGDTDVPGKLTANASVKFRDVTKNGSKSFDISVRKMPVSLAEAQQVKIADGGASYPAGNDDGSIFVAPVRFKKDGVNIYGFNSVEILDSGKPELRSGTETEPKTYDENESIVAAGIHGSNVIGVSLALNDDAKPRIFTVAMNGSGVMSDDVLNEIEITSGVPIHRATGFNHDQSIVAVMIKTAEETVITEIYSVSDDGGIQHVRTIDMKPGAEYGFHGPVAVNDDGTTVYQKISGNTGVIMSTLGSHKAIDLEDTARVWYHNGRLFVNTYEGNVMSYKDDLTGKQEFSTGTGGRMYGGAGRGDYFFLPVQRSTPELNGVYQLEIQSDGSLKEIALSKAPAGSDGPNRFTVSGDGKTLFYSHRVRKGDNKGRWFGVVKLK